MVSAVKEVTDPSLLQELEGSQPAGMEVTDPNILSQLEGAPIEQPMKQAQEPVAPNYSEMGFGERLQSIIEGIPRTSGLTARSAIQGVGGMVDFMGTPIRAGMQYAGMQDPAGGGKLLADYLGLPEPISPTEKVVAGAEEIMTGGMGLMGGMGKAAQMVKPGVSQKVMQAMAARPELQLSSAVGSGVAGGIAKETGGGWESQLAASILGGVAAPMGVAGTQKLFSGGKAVIDKIMGDPQLNAKIDLVLDSAVKSQGGTLDDLTYSVRTQLQKDMKQAMQKGDMSPDVVRRLVDYRTTGLTPTAGSLTLDPGIVTRQKNLAALGVSSKDPKLQELAQIQSRNNKKLIENLNNLGADKSGSNYNAGNKIIEALDEKNTVEMAKIDKLWSKARDTQGRSAQLDPRSFTQKANDLLDEKMVGDLLPSDIRNKLNSMAKGEIPLTVDVAEQFKTNMATLSRNTPDKSIKLALGQVRQALDDTPMLAGQDIGKEAISAFNQARKATYKWMSKVDDIPALKAVRDGVEPDKFTQTYVIGTGKAGSINNVMKMKNLLKDDPQALAVVKDNVAQFLKGKALSGAADEVGTFSQAGFNRALKSIGDEKLQILFGDDFKILKSIGRVASYEQVQPSGSAVNNSKTAAAAISGILDGIGGSTLVRRIPYGAGLVADPAKTIAGSIEAGTMTKVPSMARQSKDAMGLAAPAIAIGTAQQQ